MEFLWGFLLFVLRMFGILNDGEQPETPSFCSCFDCSETVLETDAFGETCLDRIQYLHNFESSLYPEEVDACHRVAAIEYPSICGACDPTRCDGRTPDPPTRTSFCGCTTSCTMSEWKSVANAADGLSCEARVTWLQTHIGEYSGSDERPACHRVAQDFPSSICAKSCDPMNCGWKPPIALYCFPPTNAQRVNYHWGPYLVQVKERDEPCGPGLNKFGRETVSFDGDSLKLRFARIGEVWQASEVRIVPKDGSSFQYGTFRFRVESISVRKVSTREVVSNELPRSLVFGLFTWDDTDDFSIRENYNKEVDIELSKWNNANNADAQFLVQPDGFPQKKRFFTGSQNDETTQQGGQLYEFTWSPGSVTWSTTAGGGQTHEYSAELALSEGREDLVQCLPANLDVRINLWNMLSDNNPPGLGIDEEVVVVLGEFSYSEMSERFRSVGERCSKNCQCESSCNNGVCASVP